jgi:hypothetical protein
MTLQIKYRYVCKSYDIMDIADRVQISEGSDILGRMKGKVGSF